MKRVFMTLALLIATVAGSYAAQSSAQESSNWLTDALGRESSDQLNQVGSFEPVEIAPGLELSYYRFVDTGVYDHDSGDRTTALLGMMKNLTDQTYDAPGFRFVMFDAEGNIVGSIDGSPLFQTIDPGASMPFTNGIFGDEPRVGEWTDVDVEICGSWPDTWSVERLGSTDGIEVRDVQEVTRTSERLELTGKVYNGTGAPVDGVWVAAVIYDAAGNFSGVQWTFVDFTIPVERTAPFDISGLYPVDALGIAGENYTYEVVAGYGSSWGAC